jgi:hypothetical protein
LSYGTASTTVKKRTMKLMKSHTKRGRKGGGKSYKRARLSRHALL